MRPAALLALVFVATAGDSPASPPDPATAVNDEEAVQDLILLAEDRPVFLRLRISLGDRPFRAAWTDSVRAIHASLDRDGDGTLKAEEADKDAFAAIVRLAAGATATPPRGELDVRPKDGVVSIDELSYALQAALGPFRVQVGRLASGRTDALFDHLDRDKDEQLTKPELAAIAGSLRRLDLDDNEMIGADELEPFRSPMAVQAANLPGRRAAPMASPPVVETVAGESSLRVARVLLKKYDKGRGEGPGTPDSKLSRTEFAIPPEAFDEADANGDDILNTDELGRFLARVPRDLKLDVALSPDGSGRATYRIGGEEIRPKGVKVRQLSNVDAQAAVGQVRLDIHIDDGASAAASARRALAGAFKAADANNDGYLEESEAAKDKAPASPLAGLFGAMDRDGDGKLYPEEAEAFVGLQSEAARGRLVLTASDHGRAIFGILDLDGDRRLGAREVMRTVDLVSSWDGDGDGRVSADEVPYHLQLTLSRGELPGLAGAGGISAPRASDAAGSSGPSARPDWFRRMDRNRDGDISRREFLGPREQFDRLDRDEDGLIDPAEAAAATAGANTRGGDR
jgi:Ca2+-binding EF-hand superfamily protein